MTVSQSDEDNQLFFSEKTSSFARYIYSITLYAYASMMVSTLRFFQTQPKEGVERSTRHRAYLTDCLSRRGALPQGVLETADI
jgi:hypothetical protein